MAKLAWRKTFPSHDDEVKAKMEVLKNKMAERKKEEERLKEYSEEELANVYMIIDLNDRCKNKYLNGKELL